MNEQQSNIRDYLDVVLKWRWIIITIFLVVVVSVVIHSFTARPVYKTTVRVAIEKENPNVVSIEEVLQMDASQADYLQTQVDILKSNSLASEVITRLNLEESPEFKAAEEDSYTAWLKDAKEWLKSFFLKAEDDGLMSEPGKIYSPLVGAYLDRLNVEPVRRTRLIDVSYEGYDPEIITKITNEHLQAYIDKNLELKFQASQDALSWLNKKLIDIQDTLRESENALQKFKEKEDIVSLGDIISLGEKGDSITHQRLSEISSALTAAKIERINLETTQNRLKQIQSRSKLIESFPKIIDNDLINQLKSSLSVLLRKKSELREKYGEKHPNMIALNAEIKQQEEKILEEINKIAKSIATAYDIALSKEKSLQREMDREKANAQDLTRKSLQFSVLQREVESNKQLYNTLLTRMKETSLTSGLRTSNVKIIDRADVPVFPVKPKKKRNILLAVIIGLAMGVGMAFFLEYLNDTIESPEDVEKHLGVPFLGPMALVARSKENEAKGEKELFAIHDSKSTVSEGLRNIRVNIAFRLQGEGSKSFVVTSANPGEGKSLFAANIAIMFAAMGKKTIVIDCDMRKPRLHELFGVEREPGLSNALIGDVPFSKIIKKGPVANMFVVSAGTIPPNPSELMTTDNMAEFSKHLRDIMDIIIYDTPPIMSVADPLIMSQVAGNVVMMLKMGETSTGIMKSVTKQLLDLNVKVVGVVLNEMGLKRRLYYGSYGKYSKYHRYYKRYYKYDYYHK